MRIEELIRQKEAEIKQRWLECVVGTYPADSRNFFLSRKNQFGNPVGAALAKQIDDYFPYILTDTPEGQTLAVPEDFIRMRAVQEFTPSQAIGFILFLKQAIIEVIGKEVEESGLDRELREIEARIDKLLLTAFEIYTKARDQLWEIKSGELKRSMFLALKLKEQEEKSNDQD